MVKTCLKFPLFIALLFGGMLSAQTAFWSEDFASGIPASWSNTDASGQNAIWTWCNDPAAGNSQPGCPSVWDDDTNQQIPFQASTATNGFATLDSDGYGNVNPSHVSRLTTSAIDCSGKSVVYIAFQTHIGVYEIDADAGAVLRVSSDNINWTQYVVFPGLTTAIRWSENPAEPIINISDAAAGKSTVYIQWQWTGSFEYQWSIDDVAMYAENPTPPHDMAIGDFYFPPSSQLQPVSQIATDTFGFSAELSNRGTQAQTNILFTVAVTTNTDELLFSDSLAIPVLSAGVKDSSFVFARQFIPALPVGEYRIKYAIKADSVDLRPNNNNVQSTFYVTDNLFAKEDGPEQGIRSNGDGDWFVGNLYRMSGGNQEKYKATKAEIAFATDPNDLLISDVEATIYLFRVADTVDVNFINFEFDDFFSNNLDWLGVGSYSAPDTVADYQLQSVDIVDFAGNAGIALDPGTRYILAVGYAGLSKKTYHAFSDDVKMFFVSTLTYSDRWYTAGFGEDANAVIRMTISLMTTTDNKPLPESTMKVFPNPIRETLNLAVAFEKPAAVTITIADLTGRVINFRDYERLTQEQLRFSLPQLASGTYLVRIATAEGSLTKKFMVQK